MSPEDAVACATALPDIATRLAAGGAVVDVGCGSGRTTAALARAFPLARVLGIDPDPAAIATARLLDSRADFAVGSPADGYPGLGGPPTLVCAFDSLHRIGPPVAALSAARTRLATRGAVLIAEARPLLPPPGRPPPGRPAAITWTTAAAWARAAGFPRFTRIAARDARWELFRLDAGPCAGSGT